MGRLCPNCIHGDCGPDPRTDRYSCPGCNQYGCRCAQPDPAAQLKGRDALLDEAMRLLYLFDEGVGHLPEVGPLEIIALRSRIEEARRVR